MKIPGLSLTLGMSQGTQEPYARATGRLGGFVIGKSLSLNDNKGILALAAGLLIANVVKKNSDKKNKKVAQLKEVGPKAAAKKPKAQPAKAPSVNPISPTF